MKTDLKSDTIDPYYSRVRLALKATEFGILTNAILVVIKLLAGVIGHSTALIADGIESTGDLFSSLVVWSGLKVSTRQASDEYHYGLSKAESLAAAIVSILLMGVGIGICIVAYRKISTPTSEPPSIFVIPVLIFAVAVKEYLYRKVFSTGVSAHSTAVKNDAIHHRLDALTSFAAIIGVLTSIIGGEKYNSADGFAALFCSAIIIWNGIIMLRESSTELLDKAPDEELIHRIYNSASSVDQVVLVEKILARKAGPGYFIALHVHADPNITLNDAHTISGIVRSTVRKNIPEVRDVLVHMEPSL